jgi:hypothetical protein
MNMKYTPHTKPALRRHANQHWIETASRTSPPPDEVRLQSYQGPDDDVPWFVIYAFFPPSPTIKLGHIGNRLKLTWKLWEFVTTAAVCDAPVFEHRLPGTVFLQTIRLFP